jgi:hypothetical protein
MQNDWASENLKVIRILMERSAVYRRALAPVMSLVGVTGLAAGGLGMARGFETSRPFAAYWAAIAVLCMAEAFLLIRRQAIREVEPFWSPPTCRIARAVSPAFFTGLVIGIAYFAVDTAKWDLVLLLILIWMVLYGLAMHAAGFFMPRGFRLFGWGYIVAGLAGIGYWIAHPAAHPVLAGAETDIPLGSSNMVMGVLFGGGHALYGIFLYFTEKRRTVV